VDSNTIEHLIEKEETEKVDLTDKEKEALSEIVKSQLPKMDKTEFVVEFKALEENSKPIQIIQDEFSRRMKEMAEIQPEMSFYSDMPNIYQVVVNTRHPLIKEIVDETADKEKEALLQYASENKKIKQMIDLALLSNSMLKGEALSDFIKRSIEMM
jgi:molecular chaperone HtpG